MFAHTETTVGAPSCPEVVVKTTILVGLVVIASSVPWPQTRAQDHRSDEAVVRSLDNELRVAALKRDVPALERMWSDQLVVNAPNNQVIIGKRAVLDDFVRTGIINFSSFERQIEFIRIDGDFATTMGLETVVPVTDSPANGLKAGQPIRRRFTNIWKRDGDTWRLFIRHANVIPAR
jgi:ketosteroid isomerase-like protein